MSRFNCCLRTVGRTFSQKYDVSILGKLGQGAGRGGGNIGEAGGPFGKIPVAREEDYFYGLQQRLLLALKGKLEEENEMRHKEIDRHRNAIKENDKLAEEIDEKLDDCTKCKSSEEE